MARKDRLESRTNVSAVEGLVLWPNLAKPIGMAVGGFVAATVCFGLAIFCSGFAVVGEIAAARFIGYGIFFVLYLLAGIGILIYLLVRLRRLIISPDRLQLLSDFGRIVGQLPYDNLMHVEMMGDRIKIILDKRKRKDTWWPRWDEGGCDVLLNAGFETDVTALHLYVRDALRAYRHKHGGRAWQT